MSFKENTPFLKTYHDKAVIIAEQPIRVCRIRKNQMNVACLRIQIFLIGKTLCLSRQTDITARVGHPHRKTKSNRFLTAFFKLKHINTLP